MSRVEEQRTVEAVRGLARDEIAPLVGRGEHGRVNRPLVRALGEHGLLEPVFPLADGRAAGRARAADLCTIREGLATESTEAETAFALQGLGAHPIFQAGSDELVRRWIPAVVAGEVVGAFALTEPEAGSDVSAVGLRAERVEGGFRLSGVKKWISNAPDADVYSLFARTSEGAGARGLTAFCVPGDAPGLTGAPLRLISPHAIGTLELDGVLVPDDHVLGDVDDGFRVAMRTLNLFRPSVGAGAVGMAQAALEAAVTYAAQRRAFGKELREFQAVSHALAEMATRVHAARLIVRAAAEAYDEGSDDVRRTSAMAKLFATETAQEVIDAAVQVHGAVALEEGHLLEHLYRDVRALRIYEGTSEIQREIIARELFR